MISLKPRLTLTGKRALWGIVFTAPFTIGFLLFFLGPMIQSFIFSLSELEVTPHGFNLNYLGFENFRYALRVDPSFMRIFTETTIRILTDIPAVIIFSFFAATLLNQEFKGRLLARVIFFMPVILTAGIIAQLEAQDILHRMLAYVADQEDTIATSRAVVQVMMQLRMPQDFIVYIVTAVNRIPDVINASAIPILIFLAGLQSIPSSLFETAKIEGATAWESFWKITFPLISPLFLTNMVFIIVDSFTAPGNSLVTYISNAAWSRGIYGVSVAMTWMYFGAIALFLVIVFGFISKHVFYME